MQSSDTISKQRQRLREKHIELTLTVQ